MERRSFLAAGLAGLTAAALSRLHADDESAASLYAAAGVDGCFVLRSLRGGADRVVNASLADEAFTPASTFKIANTIIGLETGVIPDERFTLKWDGVRRDFVDQWNRDHDLAGAMKYSVVWYYQEIARRVGEERYRAWLETLDYGNRDIGGGVDRFWLSPGGGLRITPRQQVTFLSRLMKHDLPVSRRSIDILLRVMPSSNAQDVTLLAKTGLGRQDGRQVGWMVGLTERAGPADVFANLVLGPIGPDAKRGPAFAARREVALAMLKKMDAVPASMGQPV